MASSWRRYWQVDLLAVVFLIVVVLFGTFLTHRQAVSDRRAENQRRAICAILATIPGHVPEIRDARRVFARPHHPDDCQPLRHARSTPGNSQPGSSPRPPSPTFVVVRPEPASQASSSPAASRTASPRPHPSHSPSPHPTKPPPKPDCDDLQYALRHPFKCLPP